MLVCFSDKSEVSHRLQAIPTILADKAFESLAAAMARDCHMGNKILQQHILPLNNVLYRATFSKKGETIVQDAVLVRHSHVYRWP